MKPNRGAFLDILSNWIHLFLHGNLDGVGIIGGIFFFWGGGQLFGDKNRSFPVFLGGAFCSKRWMKFSDEELVVVFFDLVI